METITVGTELETVHCCGCGGTYAINAEYVKRKRETGGFWHCPYCDGEWGYEKDGSEIAKLKRKLEYQEADAARERKWRHEAEDRHSHTQRRLSATQGAVTRIKNRVGKGVCPCCNRHFANLERHMASKHSDYATATQGD